MKRVLPSVRLKEEIEDMLAKVIPRFPTERSCLSLLYASLITASKHWRGIPMVPATVKELQQLRVAMTMPTKEEAVA